MRLATILALLSLTSCNIYRDVNVIRSTACGEEDGGPSQDASAALDASPDTTADLAPDTSPDTSPDTAPDTAPDTTPVVTGVWQNVTPSDMEMTDFGVNAVVADPVVKTRVWALTSNQGVWRSEDLGSSWTRVSSLGNLHWTLVVDSDPARDPATYPRLWASAGYGTGIGISDDGGATWTNRLVGNTVALAASGDNGFSNDVYHLAVDPVDGQHLLATFHAFPGVSESNDGGQTWATIAAVDSTTGDSQYVWFIDPSPAEAAAGATVSSTWLIQSQMRWDGGTAGLRRTVNSGQTWTKVSVLEHPHGNGQLFNAGGGVLYAAGLGAWDHGIYRSADYGVSWTQVNDGTVQAGVYGTPNYIYADYGWASQSGQPQVLQRTPRSSGTVWTNYYPQAPQSNGSMQATVTYDASAGRYVIITGNWLAGIWRYVE